MANILKRNTKLLHFLTFLVLLSPLLSFSKSIIVDSAGIACAEVQAARTGLAILQEGGNAMDALVAVAFSLSVTYPRAGNLGGGGFILYRTAEGQFLALDFREVAPSRATPNMYLSPDGTPLTELSQIGALACGVPGTVRGLYHAYKKFGSLPWQQLLRPAILLAENGFEVDEYLHRLLVEKHKYFQQVGSSYQQFYPGGNPPLPGDTLRLPDLAGTLRLIAAEGDRAFYEGAIAQQIVNTMEKYGGLINQRDLRNYRAKERTPVRISYGNYTLVSVPPPSSGGLVLQGIFNTLKLAHIPENYPHNSSDYIALLSEIEKHWYARRNLYLGDPDFVEIPFQLFASPAEASLVFKNVSPRKPFPSTAMPEFSKILSATEQPQTTHITILDKKGNMAAMTTTLNGNFGNYLVVEGAGFLLNNEMDDFAIKPGLPNLYQLIQGRANAVQPGKRMLSSMSPTIVEKDAQLVGALGSPGGATIITTLLQVLLNKIDFQMSLDQAVNSGRFHHQWLPDTIFYERNNFPDSVLSALTSRGFHISPRSSMGVVQAIWKSGRQWEITSDPRGKGQPLGY